MATTKRQRKVLTSSLQPQTVKASSTDSKQPSRTNTCQQSLTATSTHIPYQKPSSKTATTTMYDIIKAVLAAIGMVVVFLVVVAAVRGYADRAFIGLAPRVVPVVVAPPAVELATLAPGAPASAAPAAEAAEAAAAAV